MGWEFNREFCRPHGAFELRGGNPQLKLWAIFGRPADLPNVLAQMPVVVGGVVEEAEVAEDLELLADFGFDAAGGRRDGLMALFSGAVDEDHGGNQAVAGEDNTRVPGAYRKDLGDERIVLDE